MLKKQKSKNVLSFEDFPVDIGVKFWSNEWHMRVWGQAFLFFLLIVPISADEGLKKNIEKMHRALADLPSEKQGQLYLELAVAYYRDQEIDRAFAYFLEALKRQAKAPHLEMDQEEAKHYQHALEDYLLRAGTEPVPAAEELLNKYGSLADENPQFIQLNFLIATAYANLGKYEDFFEKFYRGYPFLYDSFLAYKTQGILYLRLSHRSTIPEERIAFQKEAIHYLNLALERNAQDPGLYKVLLFLAKDEKNASLVLSYLQNIVRNQVVLPRNDIYLYVKEAVALGDFVLGQEMIDQAKAHYAYSRAISAAQDYLDQHRHSNQRG